MARHRHFAYQPISGYNTYPVSYTHLVKTNDTGKIESVVTTDADGNVTGSDDGNGAKSDSNDLNPDGYSSGEK